MTTHENQYTWLTKFLSSEADILAAQSLHKYGFHGEPCRGETRTSLENLVGMAIKSLGAKMVAKIMVDHSSQKPHTF